MLVARWDTLERFLRELIATTLECELYASFTRWTVRYTHNERTADYSEYNPCNRYCGRRRFGTFSFSRRSPNRDLSWCPVNQRYGRTALAEPRSVCGSKALVRLGWPHRHTGFLLRFCSEVEASSHSPGKRGRLS